MELSLAPHEILIAILQQVPLQHRLGSCARVRTQWLTAAGAATQDIVLTITKYRQAPQLMHWIRKYGQHLLLLHVMDHTRCPVAQAIDDHCHDDIHVSNAPDPQHPFVWRDLPCPQLQQFRLESAHAGCSYECSPPPGSTLGPHSRNWMSLSSGRSLGLHAAASSLTSLQLSCCRVQGPGGWDSTVALQGLSSLQHLKLSHMALSPATLQLPCLAQLKRLQLQDTGLSNLSCLTWLEQMQLRVSQLSAAVWADLRQIQHCQHLTHLSLDTFSGANAPAAVYSADASPWIGTLTSLQSLHLEGNFVLVAAVLQPLTAITSLSLDSLRGAVHPSFAALLSVLPDLQQLQCLRLRHVPSDTAPAAAFSSIAVCSRLQQLTLERCPVPFGAWEAMFLGQHLPQLHTLSFKEVAVMQPQAQQDEGLAAAAAGPGAQLAGAVDAAGGVGEQGGQALADPPLCFTAAHLDMLADCCPALQSLQLSLRPPVGGRFEYLSWDPACVPSALLRLPLTRLCLEYLEQPAFPVLAQLTGLQHLSVSDARRCLRSGVIAPLTALTGLTYLDLRMILYEQMPHTPGGTVGQGVCLTGSGLCNQAGPESLPDVWTQLQDIVKQYKQ